MVSNKYYYILLLSILSLNICAQTTEGLRTNCPLNKQMPVFVDQDNDGYGAGTTIGSFCNIIPGFSFDNSDCDDLDFDANIPKNWYQDLDEDGFGSKNETPVFTCLRPITDSDGFTFISYVTNNDDCDDFNFGQVQETYYLDADGDGYGSKHPNHVLVSCTLPVGYVANNYDSDDSNALIIDIPFNHTCPPQQTTTVYLDRDRDGVGRAFPVFSGGCSSLPEGYSFSGGDCDDEDPTIQVQYYYKDIDGDGFGDPNTQIGCSFLMPPGYDVTNGDDCNDSDPNITDGDYLYFDQDGDGYGNKLIYKKGCQEAGQYVFNSGDCDDNDVTINPTNIWYSDADFDGYGDPNITTTSCDQPYGYVANNLDQCPLEGGSNSGCVVIGNTALSDNKNYIREVTSLEALQVIDETTNANSYIDNLTYFDDRGRTEQTISITAGGQQQDIVTHLNYDNLGRQIKGFLPYALNTVSGDKSFRHNDFSSTANFYNTTKYENTLNPYSEKHVEASPLNRILEQGAPGADWAVDKLNDTDHTIKFEYKTNAVTDLVRHYKVDFPEVTGILNTEAPQLTDNNMYVSNELYKTVTKDENWQPGQIHPKDHTVEEYKDKLGRVILKRTYNANIQHDTYYVYDDFGNLTYVLPPKVDTSVGVGASELSELCYQYKYDQRNRLIEKKIPGKEWEYIVYDGLDRPILTQDYNLRYNTNLTPKNKWLFTKYDVFGRVVYTGIYTHSSLLSQSEMQNALDIFYMDDGSNPVPNLYEEKLNTENNNHFYSNQSFPNINIELLTINYYDDYIFSIPSPITKPTSVWVDGDVANNTTGLATGSKVKVLDTNSWITNVIAYDEKARSIWIGGSNDYLTTVDIVKSKLNFIGSPTEVVSIHKKENNVDIVVTDFFEYDHMQRLTSQYQSISDHQFLSDNGNLTLSSTLSTEHIATNSIKLLSGFTGLPGFEGKIGVVNTIKKELITYNIYDELGQLNSKKVGGDMASTPENASGLQTVDYKYNIRGWLKQINNPITLGSNLFGFKIDYNEGANALYNGNISSTQWKTANTDNSLKTYNSQYDALNRITAATNSSNNYNLNSVAYDKNGNITSLVRRGHTNEGATTFGEMDNLIYTYESNSNQLKKVLDNGNDTYGFKDGVNQTTEYTYDANGNMLTDVNKGITSISYNHLNLPTKIVFNGLDPLYSHFWKSIQYIYDASGSKLEKKVKTGTVGGSKGNQAKTVSTFYAGNYVYEGSSLKFFNHPEGYVEPVGNGTYRYIYQYKDHLGNVRLSYQDANQNNSNPVSLEILEENNYYPFGLKHKGYNSNVISENNYFNYVGKELNESLDYNMLEMDWRHYDPAIGRFVTIDVYAESYNNFTPYHYSKNNPIWFKDPSGLFTDVVNEDTGEVYNVNDGYDFTFVVSATDFAEISESGAIPKRLNGAWNKEFWRQVWNAFIGGEEDIVDFVIIDEIESGVEVADEVSKGQYGSAILLVFLKKVQKLKKGGKLIKKLFKHADKTRLPTPNLDPDQFKKVGDKFIHKKTGAIFSKSKTSHGNVGNAGEQWKAWSKGTTDFGSASKKSGARVTIDGAGEVIGN